MDKKIFKEMFDEIAQKNGFEKAFNMWFKEQGESLVVFDLQRSNYSHLYYVNINVYLQGLFGRTFKKSKDLKFGAGGAAIFRRTPNEYESALNQENSLADIERKEMLEKMFSDFIVPFTEKTSTREKIIEIYNQTKDQFFLLPAVKKELGIKLDESETSN